MNTENPYAPPASEVLAPTSAPEEHELASAGQRFTNFMIDSVGAVLVGVFLGYTLTFAGVVEHAVVVFDHWASGIVLTLAYYGAFEGLTGRTPAKLVTGTKVVAASGDRPTFGQVLGRSLARMVPFEPFSFLGSPSPIGWHDSWSKTRVVRTRARLLSYSSSNSSDATCR